MDPRRPVLPEVKYIETDEPKLWVRPEVGILTPVPPDENPPDRRDPGEAAAGDFELC